MGSEVFRKAALIGAACTLVQGVVWFALSLVALLATQNVLEIREPKASDIFPSALLSCYFPEDGNHGGLETCCENLVMPGNGMLGISIVYMVVSITWTIFATMLVTDLNGERKRVPTLTQIWAGFTIGVCFLDFIVAILFGVDYGMMTRNDSTECGFLLSVSGFLMSLAARGYVLWLLNLVAAIWLLKAARTVDVVYPRASKRSSNASYYHDPVDALALDSTSMVFHGGVERPWAGRDPRSPTHAPVNAWDAPDARSQGPGTQRGGLAQRMAHQPQSPALHSQSPGLHPQSPALHPPSPGYGQLSRGPLTPTSPAPRPQLNGPSQPNRNYPAPDYDVRNGGGPGAGGGPAPRSVLKKPPPPPVMIPAPGLSPASPSSIDNWRQQVQQPDNRFQRSGNQNFYDNRGYDNRGYDGGRTGF